MSIGVGASDMAIHRRPDVVEGSLYGGTSAPSYAEPIELTHHRTLQRQQRLVHIVHRRIIRRWGSIWHCRLIPQAVQRRFRPIVCLAGERHSHHHGQATPLPPL